MKHLTHIEPLEDRIAPATIINPYTVTFQDTDGDSAIVTISKPLFKNPTAAGKILVFTTNDGSTEAFTGNGVGESLSTINLLGRTDAQDMSISVKVIPQVGVGNGQVNVGAIEAANFTVANQVTQNIDLGNITIQGDLGFITAGDNFATPAMKTLTVQSMSTGNTSEVLGPIVKLNVLGNFNSNLAVIGYQFGTIDTINIGGSLSPDSNGDADTGLIQFTGHVGRATIGSITGGPNTNTGELLGLSANLSKIGSLHVLGDITGGAGADSGRVYADTSIGSVTVDGAILGGGGQDSGEVSGSLGTVKIAGGVTGGSGVNSGSILGQFLNATSKTIAAPIGSLTIGGDVTGGSGVSSGDIAGILGTVIIKGNLTGGSGVSSGAILSQVTLPAGTMSPAPMGTLVIAKNLTGGSAGTAAYTGSPATPAVPGDSGIVSALSARSITIGGSLIGGTPGTATNSNHTLTQTADTSGAILVNSVTSLTIGANIVGGDGPNSGIIEAQNGASAYGSIIVNGAVTGGAGDKTGSIFVNAVKSLSIGASLTGGAGDDSGAIEPQSVSSTVAYGTVTVRGNIVGAAGANSGSIYLNVGSSALKGTLGNFHLGGSLIGGSNATRSGEVFAFSSLGPAFIGGSIIGGTGDNSGVLGTTGPLSATVVMGNLTGGQSINSASAVTDSGLIQGGGIVSLDIKGSVTSGVNAGAGTLANCGSIRSTIDIASLTIGGSVTGTTADPVVISAAHGVINSRKPTVDLAIASVTIAGNATWMDLLAGYDGSNTSGSPLGAQVDGSAQIASVTITGNLASSNVVAGVKPDSGGQFGTVGDAAISTRLASGAKSAIASLVIGGTANGDANPADNFGIVAETVARVTVQNGANLAANLTPGTPKSIDTNLFILEVTS